MKTPDQMKQDLLVWAGYHRGTGISEEAMTRFHEIIDSFDELDIPVLCQRCGNELTERGMEVVRKLLESK